MLNTFPFLLSLSFFAPLLLRIVLGAAILWLSFEIVQKTKNGTEQKSPFVFSYIPVFSGLVIGILMITGSWAQILAVLSIIYIATALVGEVLVGRKTDRIIIYILLIAISASILTTGAGALAFDLPL